ncbi:MAG: hypothetical protein SFX73_16580 [Kofleriaceae bacterium]|nr:hypothetical protein [Kofleriaceae bacterium]
MPRAAALALVHVAVAATAHADVHADNFAIYASLDRSQILDTATFELPRGSEYERVLVGTYKRRELVGQHVFLEHCTRKECFGVSLWLNAGKVEVLGVVDLDGAVVAFPDKAIYVRAFAKVSADKVAIGRPKQMKWPALVVRTVEESTENTTDRADRPVTGTRRASHLHVVSLLRKDEQHPRVFEAQVVGRGASGSGFYTTLTFEQGAGQTLEIVTSYQRTIDRALACLPPPPVVTRYRLGKERRYVAANSAPHRTGCH